MCDIVLENKTKGDMMMSGVIRLINKARKALGLDETYGLPRGFRGDCYRCPLARSFPKQLGISVKQKYAFVPSQSVARQLAKAWNTWSSAIKDSDGMIKPAVRLPEQLETFVRKFDLGDYPEYEIEPELE